MSVFGPYNPSKSILFSWKFIKIASKFPSLSVNLSIISAVESFFKNIATPLAWEENELKTHLPPHSSRTTFSIVLHIRVSQTITKSGFFFLKLWKTFLLFGLRPIEFALKHWILKLVAEPAPPLLLSCVASFRWYTFI